MIVVIAGMSPNKTVQLLMRQGLDFLAVGRWLNGHRQQRQMMLALMALLERPALDAFDWQLQNSQGNELAVFRE